MSITAGFQIPRRAKYDDPITQSFVNDRLTFLDKTAKFRRIQLHWCLTIEPELSNPFATKPKEKSNENARLIASLQKAAAILETHLAPHIGIRLLAKEETFQFFSRLFNLEDWAGAAKLRSDINVDSQIATSPVSWEADHLRIGTRYRAELNVKIPGIDGMSADDIKKSIDPVIADPAIASAVESKTVKLGMTPDEVKKSLGNPDKIVDLGTKQVFIYKDMKVILIDGKVSDVQ